MLKKISKPFGETLGEKFDRENIKNPFALNKKGCVEMYCMHCGKKIDENHSDTASLWDSSESSNEKRLW